MSRRTTRTEPRVDDRPRATPEDARALDAKLAAAEAEVRRQWTPGERRIIALLEVLVRKAGGSVPSVVSPKDVLTPEELARRSDGWAEVGKGFARTSRVASRRGADENAGHLPPAGGVPPEKFFARREPGGSRA